VGTGITALRNNLDAIFGFIKDSIIQPVINRVNQLLNLLGRARDAADEAMRGISNTLGEAGTTATKAGFAAPSFLSNPGGWIGAQIGKSIGFAQGANLIPRDMTAMLHAGEAVIPADMNPYNPNATQAAGTGQQISITIGNVTASGVQEGRDAGGAFADELVSRLRATGVL
jgi:hypothetical protein